MVKEPIYCGATTKKGAGRGVAAIEAVAVSAAQGFEAIYGWQAGRLGEYMSRSAFGWMGSKRGRLGSISNGAAEK